MHHQVRCPLPSYEYTTLATMRSSQSGCPRSAPKTPRDAPSQRLRVPVAPHFRRMSSGPAAGPSRQCPNEPMNNSRKSDLQRRDRIE